MIIIKLIIKLNDHNLINNKIKKDDKKNLYIKFNPIFNHKLILNL
jgi:hypothetical protein